VAEDKALQLFLEKRDEILKEDKIVPLKEACKSNGEYTASFPLGFKLFDDAMKGGVRGGDMIICTGKSKSGKTTLCENFTYNLSIAGFPSLWFSYEVLVDNLYAKFKEMGSVENIKAYAPQKCVSGNISWISEKIKEGLKEFGTKFVFIDHLDFLTPAAKNNMDILRIAIRDICAELKSIALNLEITIFLVAHIRKIPHDRIVEMQDLGESKSLYQIPDYIFAVQRLEEENNIGTNKLRITKPNSVLRMLKNRLTGIEPIIKYRLENNIIKPFFDEDVIKFNKNYYDNTHHDSREDLKIDEIQII